jgi:arsenate reductase
MSTDKKKVLFLCTGNSCRSQMAEGWAKSLHGQTIDAYSAGTSPHSVNPLAIMAMAEVGIDISGHESKQLNSLNHVQFDLVITVCDNAARSCSIAPKGVRVVHVPFQDPPQLAKDTESDKDALQHYRRVRDEIKHVISKLPSFFTTENMEVNR